MSDGPAQAALARPTPRGGAQEGVNPLLAAWPGGLSLKAKGLLTYPGPLFLFNASGRVERCNLEGLQMLPLLSTPAAAIIPRLAMEALESGRLLVKLVEIPNADGTRFLDLTFMPMAAGHVAALARDVSMDRAFNAALVDSRQRYKDLVEISTDFSWEVGLDPSDGKARFVFVSPRGALGYPARRLVDQEPSLFLVDDADSWAFLAQAEIDNLEIQMLRPGGEIAHVQVAALPLRGPDGRWTGARGVCRDVTEIRRREAELRRAEERERLRAHVVDTFREQVDPRDMVGVASALLRNAVGADGCRVLRVAPAEGGIAVLPGHIVVPVDLDGRIFLEEGRDGQVGDDRAGLRLVNGADRVGGVVSVEGEEGAYLVAATSHRRRVNGAVTLWRGRGGKPWIEEEKRLLADVAPQIGVALEQIASNEQIVRLSRTDVLTGLFNRRAFFAELERRLIRQKRTGEPATLLYVDLDNFKQVNDFHGHKRGDEALLAVRDILIGNTRPTDLVARLGGDEFAIWLDGAGEEVGLRKAEALLAAATTLRVFSGSAEAPLGLSLGVAIHLPESGESFDDLLARADNAMYTAKRDGKGSYSLAPPAR